MSFALELAAQLAIDAWKRHPGVDPDALGRRMAELEEALEEAARARAARAVGPAPDGRIDVAGERVAPSTVLRAGLAAAIVPPDPASPLKPAPSSSRLPCCGRPMGWCACGI